MDRQSPEERFLADILGCRTERFFYPYIIIRDESGALQRITLQEAIEKALNSLSCTKGKKDTEKQPRFKRVLMLRYGLLGEPSKTFKQIDAEFGVSTARSREMFWRSYRNVRMRNTGIFEQFLIPSPEEVLKLREKGAEAVFLRKENDALHAAIPDSKTIETDCAGIPWVIYKLPIEKIASLLPIMAYYAIKRNLHARQQQLVIGELLKMTEADLLGERNFGPKSLAKLYEGLKALNLLQYSRFERR